MSLLNKKRNRENTNHITTHRLDWGQVSRWWSWKRKNHLNIACFLLLLWDFPCWNLERGNQNKLQHCWTHVRFFCSCITIFIWLLSSCYKAFNSTNLCCEITNSIMLQHFIIHQRFKIWISNISLDKICRHMPQHIFARTLQWSPPT